MYNNYYVYPNGRTYLSEENTEQVAYFLRCEFGFSDESDFCYEVQVLKNGVVVGTPVDYYGNQLDHWLVSVPVELEGSVDLLECVDLEQTRKEA